jgi:hypothetical protein
MIMLDLTVGGMSRVALASRLKRAISEVPADAVLQLRLHGRLSEGMRGVVTAASLRSITPPTMNVEMRVMDETRSRR